MQTTASTTSARPPATCRSGRAGRRRSPRCFSCSSGIRARAACAPADSPAGRASPRAPRPMRFFTSWMLRRRCSNLPAPRQRCRQARWRSGECRPRCAPGCAPGTRHDGEGALSSLPAPAEHAAAQFFRERVLAHEKRQHRAPKTLEEQPLGHRRQGDKRAIGQERSVGGEHMHVRAEVGEVARRSPSGLHKQDQPRARTGRTPGAGAWAR